MKLTRKFWPLVSCLIIGFVFTDLAAASKEEEDLFVHPFFAHMSLADPAGTASFRLTGIHAKSAESTGADFAAHIEAGILPRVGIHIRNDAVKREPYSEVMLMYNLWTTQDESYGLSAFGQLSIPTGSEVDDYKGLFGAAVKATLAPVMVFNGNVHYDPKDDMAEWENAFVFRASPFLYPILEVRGESNKGADSAYLLPGIKFRVRENQTIGAGFQFAMTDSREYDNEVFLQYGVEF